MSYPIKVTPGAPGGTTYTNESGVAQLVTLVEGPGDPESVRLGKQRTLRTVIGPGKSRTFDISPAAKLTTSTDTSPLEGSVTIVGGSCGHGCTHGED